MFNIRKSETYSWDAANNISREQVEEFIKLLQYQLSLDLKPVISTDLPFEIADRSTGAAVMTWNEAVEYVKSLGDGWRLPTKDELNQIYESNNDFIAGNYWSGTEGNGYGAWAQGMSNGLQGNYYKNYSYYVRAVRDI